jgi:hypothetical protein
MLQRLHVLPKSRCCDIFTPTLFPPSAGSGSPTSRSSSGTHRTASDSILNASRAIDTKYGHTHHPGCVEERDARQLHGPPMSVFFKLSSTTMNPCTMVKPVYEQARRTWLCIGCAFPKPGTKAVDASIQEEEPDNTPLNMVSGCGLGVARKDFLFSFGENLVRQHLYLGHVFGPDKRPLDNWMTFIGRHRIIVRGSRNAGVRRCSECGRNVYFAMGPLYLYPEPPPDIAIFDAGNGGLVINGDLVRRVNLNAWRQLDCTKLTVLASPKDGLHELKGM